MRSLSHIRMHMQETEETVEMEVPETFPKREGEGGLMAAGIYGDADAAALADRQKRIDNFKKRLDFRECISCDRCSFCLEVRRFSETGQEEIAGLFCLDAGFEVLATNTCNLARRHAKGRKKVLYDLKYAPMSFRLGIEKKMELHAIKGSDTKAVEPTYPVDGYRGGSKFYVRADGGDVGSGKIPKSLGN